MSSRIARQTHVAYILSEFLDAIQSGVEEQAGEPAGIVIVVEVGGNTVAVGNLDPFCSRDLLDTAMEICRLDCEAFEAVRANEGEPDRPH